MFEDIVPKEEKVIRIENKRFIASKQLEPGTALFIEPPLVSVPLPSKRHQRCNYCLCKAQLQCCSRCRSAYFCSNACFRNAWLQFHRILCEPQERDIYVHVDADPWLLQRAALILHSLNKQQSHSPPNIAIKVLQELDTRDLCDTGSEWIEDVATFLSPFDCQFSLEQLRSFWRRLQVCSFPISDLEHHMDQIAVGVYPITAMYVQHSCRPNSAVVYKEGKQYLIAIETIHSGDPITIAYADLISTKRQRWGQLKMRFGKDYECNCIRCCGELSGLDTLLEKGHRTVPDEDKGKKLISQCIKEWSVLNMFKHADQIENWTPIEVMNPHHFTRIASRIIIPEICSTTMSSRKRYHHINKTHVSQDKSQLLSRLPIAIEAISNVPDVPAFTSSSIHAAEKVLIDRMKAGNWVEASRCSLYLFIAYCFIYPPHHPKASYHSLILARSCWNALVEMELIGINRKLERVYENGTHAWIEWAKDAVCLTFGKETKLWREVIELQWVFDREQKVKASN
ncbi:hypothetical protein G6F46_002463 [Rhizopus delemar]|uniref:MYND-type domain-containing protein n=3 Tax=Rhizopus TaxID=4842 RepID=I1BNC6_RHIO9|nr:hypothetical protein RO3G_02410 [Rhizopus delemar RA 99-880]KAG1465295.1 hypothetical protein G6F55_001230 [Rhizopus delemar]KAG1545421.1 hypothetical protein G6F51_005483 [Rhizopus arrhizus]KAG1503514.1 hypothetical protein G6F54_001628 [Rhizopus delemar]KAG1517627.1 hypothetical protein G6F53_001226 [Rhizopus delemar]|eukprot:EIE77706.1 hypothetical protein RO3G_02410 [Rhizopus delemar RA 99-880]